MDEEAILGGLRSPDRRSDDPDRDTPRSRGRYDDGEALSLSIFAAPGLRFNSRRGRLPRGESATALGQRRCGRGGPD